MHVHVCLCVLKHYASAIRYTEGMLLILIMHCLISQLVCMYVFIVLTESKDRRDPETAHEREQLRRQREEIAMLKEQLQQQVCVAAITSQSSALIV